MSNIIIQESRSKTALLLAIKVNTSDNFHASDERNIRSLISGYIKRKYPLRDFSTTVQNEVLIVKRNADLISE